MPDRFKVKCIINQMSFKANSSYILFTSQDETVEAEDAGEGIETNMDEKYDEVGVEQEHLNLFDRLFIRHQFQHHTTKRCIFRARIQHF